MKKFRTLSIGGATFDTFLFTEENFVQSTNDGDALVLPLGSKIHASKVVGTCGGGACNTAVGLAKLGSMSSFCGVIGDDQWGHNLLTNMNEKGVDTSFATVIEKEFSSCSIILNAPTGERVIINQPGTTHHLHDVTFPKENLGDFDWIYLNHLQPVSDMIHDDLVDKLAHMQKRHLTWNPGGSTIKAGIATPLVTHMLSLTGLVIMNKEEALAFTKTENIEDALRALTAAGAHISCITDGKKGAFATDGKTLYFCPALEEPVVDTTGAGDAFGTAMTWALMHEKTLPEALKAGSIEAMSVVGAIGAQKGLLTETSLVDSLAATQLVVSESSL